MRLVECNVSQVDRKVGCRFVVVNVSVVQSIPPFGQALDELRRYAGLAHFSASKFSQNPLYGLAQSLTPGVLRIFIVAKRPLKRIQKAFCILFSFCF